MNTRPGFWRVGFLLGMIMVAANVPTPLYALYSARFHFGPAVLTAIFATYVVFLIPSLLFWGQWSDQRGRKPALLIGLAFAVLGSLSFLFAHQVLWLFAGRAAQGLGAGMLSGPATAQLAELDPSRRRAPLVAGLATAGGTAIGPLAGGLLAQYGPEPLRLAYGVSLAGLALAGLLLAGVADTRLHSHAPLQWQPPRIPRAMRRTFWLASGSAFVVWSVTAFFMSLAPTYVMTLLHVSNVALAGGVVFLMLACASVTQLLTRTLSPAQSMPAGLLVIFLGVAGLLVSVPDHSLTLLLASTVIAGIGQGMAFLGSMTAVTQAAPASLKAQVVSSFYVVIYCGVGLPVVGIGLLAQHVGLYDAMLSYTILIGILTLGLVSGLRLRRFGAQAADS